VTSARTIARRVPTASDCSDVLTQLQRAVQLLRLYPSTHPHCAGAVQDVRGALTRFHAAHGPLSVEVRRDGVTLEDVPVRTSGQDADLADLLYPEGVRALTFEEGVTQAELFGFLATLAGHGLDEAVERDLLDALWRLELVGIHYMAHDELSPAAVAAERHDPLLRSVTERIRSLVAELEPGSEQAPTDLEVWLERSPSRVAPAEEERLAEARRALASSEPLKRSIWAP